MPVRFGVRKILDIYVYFRVAVHVKDALIGPAKHGGYVPGSFCRSGHRFRQNCAARW